MGDTNGAPQIPLHNVGLKVQLQTIVPSAIRKPNSVGASHSVASTLRGLHDKNLPPSVDLASLPDGWTKVKHPDAGVYYVNEEKGMYTVSDLLNPKTRALLMQGAEVLQGSPALKALLEDQEVDVVLDVRQTKEGTRTSYYCVSHVERRIFWLQGIGHEEVDIPCTSNKCTHADVSRVHCIEAQYWKHCELLPTTFMVTKDVTGDLKDILLQAAADRLLVKFSTSPYNKDDLEYMLNLVKEIEADVREGSGHAAWIIGTHDSMLFFNPPLTRVMFQQDSWLSPSSYGQVDDYFDIEDTGPTVGPYKRPILLTIFAPLFLKSPDVYAVELHSFHENFTLERWRSFVHKVDTSIRDSNLLACRILCFRSAIPHATICCVKATVLLSTNVGLLSWGDGGRKGGINSPTAVQIVTYISIICTVGSIIIGLAIFKQYRAKRADTPLRAVVVLRRILKEPFGLERLSIICSLPYVLLMWGLIAFLLAFGIIFYEQTGIQVRIPVSVALFLVLLCLFFCLYTAGPPEREDQKPQKPSRIDQHASSKV
ncbi:hypothetical protein V8E55_011755 [Tylopilus felleus]